MEVHVQQPEQWADLPLQYLPQPTLLRAHSWHLQLLAMALHWAPEQPSAQPSCLLSVSVFDLHLWSPSKKVSNCKRGNNFDRLNISRRGSMEYFQVNTIRTKLTEVNRSNL